MALPQARRACVTTHGDPQGRADRVRAPARGPAARDLGRPARPQHRGAAAAHQRRRAGAAPGAAGDRLAAPLPRAGARHRRSQPTLDGLARGIAIDGIAATARSRRRSTAQQGANAWLTIGLREGKNREVRSVLESIGADGQPADPRRLSGRSSSASWSAARSRRCRSACCTNRSRSSSRTGVTSRPSRTWARPRRSRGRSPGIHPTFTR